MPRYIGKNLVIYTLDKCWILGIIERIRYIFWERYDV